MAGVLEGEGVGVALKLFNEVVLANGLQALLQLAADPATRARFVAAAQKHFSLAEGVRRDAEVYELLESAA